MRILIAVATAALSVGMAGECFAGCAAGGSRLIYYYRETSFRPGRRVVMPLTVTNNNAVDPVTVRFVIFNGANCNSAGPFNTTLASSETKQIAVTDFAPAATFPSRVIDLWAINGVNQAIRFDALTGTSVIADFGP